MRKLMAGLGFTAQLRRRGEDQRDIRELGHRAQGAGWLSARTAG
jgi:hypothetical protein